MRLFATPVHPIRRTVTVALTALAAFAGVASTITAPAAVAAPQQANRVSALSAGGAASTVAFTNRKREAKGPRTLKRVKHLNKVAAGQARRMARTQHLHHNPNLSREIKNWCAYGENVAYAGSVARANVALWKSPGHRANMLNHRFNQMGAAVAVDGGGTRWVVHVFRKKC